jgi:hypothetical protein
VRLFWPAAEAAQVDYETLRASALSGIPFLGIAGGRFERRGVAGLVERPVAESVFSARLFGGVRPPWTPQVDPRLDTLAAGYSLVLSALTQNIPTTLEAHQ